MKLPRQNFPTSTNGARPHPALLLQLLYSMTSSAVADSQDMFSQSAGHASLLRLDLHRLARVLRRANSDNEIPLRRRAGALRNLTDRADGVDDGGACRIRHEPSERF